MLGGWAVRAGRGGGGLLQRGSSSTEEGVEKAGASEGPAPVCPDNSLLGDVVLSLCRRPAKWGDLTAPARLSAGCWEEVKRHG